MKKDLQYYQQWLNKWIRVFRKLCDNYSVKNYRVQVLIEKIKHHFWAIEWRLLCVKWFDNKAEENILFPKTLRYE